VCRRPTQATSKTRDNVDIGREYVLPLHARVIGQIVSAGGVRSELAVREAWAGGQGRLEQSPAVRNWIQRRWRRGDRLVHDLHNVSSRVCPLKRDTLIYAGLAVLVSFPFILSLILGSYSPSDDEAFQLEAAMRLGKGNGYTASWLVPADLGTPAFSFLATWPVGYSLLVSGLLNLGAPVAFAANSIRLVAMVWAVVGWTAMGRMILNRLPLMVVFSAALGVYVTVFASSVTDLITFAVASTVSLHVVRLRASRSEARKAVIPTLRSLGVAGFLAGLLIAVKYSAAPIALAVVAWVALVNWRKPYAMLRSMVAFAAPAALIVVPIFVTNYLNSGSAGYLTTRGTTDRLYWDPRWVLDSLGAFLVDGLYVPRIVLRALFGEPADANSVLARVGVAAATAAMLVVSMFRLTRGNQIERRLVGWFGLAYGAQVLFLGLTTVAYFGPGAEWTPLKEGRYYEWLVPVGLLCVLGGIQRGVREQISGRKRLGQIVCSAVVVGCVLASSRYSYYGFHIAHTRNGAAQAASRELHAILKVQGYPSFVVFADSYNFAVFPRTDGTNTFSGPAAIDSNTYFSRRTLVAMVCTRKELRHSNYGADYCYENGFDSVARAHEFNELGLVGHNTLYWKTYAPGAATGNSN
jgi:hypothetical protein